MSHQKAPQRQRNETTTLLRYNGLLQRSCGCGKRTTGGNPCSSCDARHDSPLRRAAVSAGTPATGVPSIVNQVLRSSGQQLDGAARSLMETRFDHDFSKVRVHTDAYAAASAQAVNARAYTVGQHIAFDKGQYEPHSVAGQRLLAHELVHVIQQRNDSAVSPSQVGSPDSDHERDADQISQTVLEEHPQNGAERSQSHIGPVSGSIQRLVRTSSVTCGTQNPFSSDRRASSLLDIALTRIASAQAARAASPADPDVVAVGDALHTAFRLNPANAATWTEGAPQVRLPVITRRLQIAKDYIDSVVFTINCPAAGAADAIAGCNSATCDAGTEAFSCHVNSVALDLCPLFWARSLNQRGRIWAHEVFHITFNVINDRTEPDVHNAHCYAQFIALLNGFNSPAGFTCH